MHILTRLDACENRYELYPDSEILGKLIKHLIQSFNLRHVAYAKELTKLQVRKVFNRNELTQEEVDSLLYLLTNHVFVRDRNLNFVYLLNLGLSESAFGGSIAEDFIFVLLIYDVEAEKICGFPIDFKDFF